MKKSILLICLSFCILLSCKKNVDDSGSFAGTQIISAASVPAAVLSTFNADFSSSTEREWRKKDDKFLCQFNLEDQRHEAEFEHNGNRDAESVICLDAAVTAIVLNSFRANFPDDIVYEWKLNNDGNWKAHFLRAGVKYEVTINATGAIIKSEHD